ncbi:NPCBM/NEW2 domain-containing protein [Streptomyces kronopolitis]|uniref:NPCBM/NEW2 domain-containing protein n=1 Tax=Streptomyces kronopolitis TaxID=1612435 RepID=UPI003424EB85
MHQQFDPIGGTQLPDTELVRRIRASARPDGGRAAAAQGGIPAQGAPVAPDAAAGEAEAALDEFHRRHYAAVLAGARACCGSSQAAADLAAEAIERVLYSPDPGEAPGGSWRESLLAAVDRTAGLWHQGSRRTELREGFADRPAGRETADRSGTYGDGPGGFLGDGFAASVRPVELHPSAAPKRSRGARSARLALLAAAAVAVLAGAALSVGSLLGPARHKTSADAPGHSGFPSAPTTHRSPTSSAKSSPSASRSASKSPSASPAKPSKHPRARPSSPARPSPAAPERKPPPTRTTPLTARPWSASSNGWGPVGQNRSVDGRPLTIAGAGFAEGLGAHAPSEIVYQLGGTCSRLGVDVGVDDEVGANGSVVFQIYRDGTEVADSGLMTVGQPARHLTADLTGGGVLRLVVTDGGNGNNSDHADWGSPLISCR